MRVDTLRVRALAWPLGLAVDESHDVIESWLAAIGGIDLDPGCLHRDPVERAAMPRKIRDVVIRPWASVRPAHRIVLTALQDPPESHLAGDHAADDTQMRKTVERLKV